MTGGVTVSGRYYRRRHSSLVSRQYSVVSGCCRCGVEGCSSVMRWKVVEELCAGRDWEISDLTALVKSSSSAASHSIPRIHVYVHRTRAESCVIKPTSRPREHTQRVRRLRARRHQPLDVLTDRQIVCDVHAQHLHAAAARCSR